MDFLKGLLVHLLFILIIWLIASILPIRKQRISNVLYKEKTIFFISAIQILLCLVFTVPSGFGYLHDLRVIPFLIGSVYGGRKVTVGLTLFMIFIRFPFGGDGFWLNLLIYLILGCALYLLGRHLQKVKQNYRIACITFVAFVYVIPAYFFPSAYFGFFDLKIFVTYLLTLSASAFFVTYLIELLRNYQLLQINAVKYEKMQVVSQLAASIGHEVRNPLTTVKGFLQLLKERSPDETNKRYAQIALEESIRATEIIEDYLSFAKPHGDKNSSIHVNEAVLKVAEILTPFANEQGIIIHTNLSNDVVIKGDSNKLRQALINICKNGIESMTSGKTLSIETKHSGKNFITIHIQDQGIGMHPEQVARLGEPFYSQKGGKGTGLGMMVVFQIVKNMGGKVGVKSKIREGTSIFLTFPIE